MTAPLSRRSLLRPVHSLAAPLALLALPASPAQASATSLADTPILRLFRQWEALLEVANAVADAAGHDREDEVWASYDVERHRIEDAIRDTPAVSAADMAVMVIVLTGEGRWALPDETILGCASLAGRSFDKLPRYLFEDAGDKVA